MAKFTALITGRYSPEVEAISNDAPSEVEIRYLPPGEALGDHVSDVDIIYGHIGEGDLATVSAGESVVDGAKRNFDRAYRRGISTHSSTYDAAVH